MKKEELEKLLERTSLSDEEIKLILSSKNKPQNRTYDHSETKRTKFGVISDTHIGEKHFDEGLWEYAGKIFKKEKIERVYHAGDILEGMSGRQGQIFDLTHIGFEAQIDYASELMRSWKGIEIYGITGNHDEWFKKIGNMGVNAGISLEERAGNFHFLGEWEADVKIAPNVIMKLYHANDQSAYASSYKLQKLIESLEGGKKPNIILSGHYHKALYLFSRNVHGFECGTLCGQTRYMRGKKIAAHKGFWIIDLGISKDGISRIQPTFYPAY